MSTPEKKTVAAAAAALAAAPEALAVSLRIDTPPNPREVGVAAALEDQGTMDKALRLGKLAAEQSLAAQIKKAETEVAANNDEIKDLWRKMQEQAEREVGKFIASDKDLVALVAILNKTLRPKVKATKQSLVRSISTWFGHGLDAVGVDNLRHMFDGQSLTFQLALNLTLSDPKNRDEDDSDYVCKVKASPELLAKAERVRKAFQKSKNAADALAELRRQLKDLPSALNAMEAQVLAAQLGQKPGGADVVEMVRNTLGAHLQGTYINLLE